MVDATEYRKQLNSTEQDLKESKETLNQYTKRIGTIMAVEKKLLIRHKRLTNFKEPVMFLQRNNGEIELFENVKETEWEVPGMPEAHDRKLHLGVPWQVEIPYAGRTFKAYWCHEDYMYPFKWGKPNIYTGELPGKIKNWTTEKEVKEHKIPIILDTANVNAEAHRDGTRKLALAWERLATSERSKTLLAIGKIIG